jgi:pseudaminic acid synthase
MITTETVLERIFQQSSQKNAQGNSTFIIAEMSGNHNHDLNRAKQIIDAAQEAGVDAVKMQTYTPDTLTIDCDKPDFIVNGTNAWAGQKLYDLYKSAYTPWEWQAELKAYGERQGILVFSTPFDPTAVDFLEKLNVLLYKVASFEAVDTELLAKIGKTRKPVILSRGLTSIEDIHTAIDTLRANGTPTIAVLHCVSSYPALPKQMNLAHIPDIRKRFGVISGLSDHSLGIDAARVAVGLMGAAIIEKHLTLKRSDGGSDAEFSLEPAEMAELVRTIRDIDKYGLKLSFKEKKQAELLIGSATYIPDRKEKENLAFVRSLYVVKDIKKDGTFTPENVRIIRPGYGLKPKIYRNIIGKKAKNDIERGTALTWDLVL